MMTPEPKPKNEITAEGVTNTSGPGAAEEDQAPADSGPKGLDAGTLPGETTSDRATGLTSSN